MIFRRKYLHAIFFIMVFLNGCRQADKIRFAICADVHHDLIFDAEERMRKFIKVASEGDAEFIIQLGDFCMPFERNSPFLEIWNSFPGGKYHVLGNHDMDVSPKIVTMQFWGMEKPFYSFDRGSFHFVILDPNFYREDEGFVAYSNSNYFDHPETRATIPVSQLEWIKDDLEKTGNFTIVFSHQSLDHSGGVANREAVREIIENANRERIKVIACFSGHDHDDNHQEINGIHYFRINSMSYKWVGGSHVCIERYPSEINEKYPSLKYTMPYADPLFAMIEISTRGDLRINGRQSRFVPPGPAELGVAGSDLAGYKSYISDRMVHFKTK